MSAVTKFESLRTHFRQLSPFSYKKINPLLKDTKDSPVQIVLTPGLTTDHVSDLYGDDDDCMEEQTNIPTRCSLLDQGWPSVHKEGGPGDHHGADDDRLHSRLSIC